jgi:hypothetical protein
MSSDSDSLIEKPTQTELIQRFYELLASGQYTGALEIVDSQPDFGGESERVVVGVLRLRQGIQKYVG